MDGGRDQIKPAVLGRVRGDDLLKPLATAGGSETHGAVAAAAATADGGDNLRTAPAVIGACGATENNGTLAEGVAEGAAGGHCLLAAPTVFEAHGTGGGRRGVVAAVGSTEGGNSLLAPAAFTGACRSDVGCAVGGAAAAGGGHILPGPAAEGRCETGGSAAVTGDRSAASAG